MKKDKSVVTKHSKTMLFDIPLLRSSLQEMPNLINSYISSKEKQTFFYVNAYCLVLAESDPEYKSILKKASLVYSGGIGPVLASKLLNLNSLIERTPTPDFINEIFNTAQAQKWSVYFLGTTKKSLTKAVEKIKRQFPQLNISGFHDGFFSKSQEANIIKEINTKRPTIVIVGMGSPKQEKWIENNYRAINSKVFWGVGAMFDVISGELPRAPLWMRKVYLEWLYRLIKEPKRLWKRYIFGNPLFLKLILIELIKKISTK